MHSELLHCKQGCQEPRRCTKLQQKQNSVYRLQDVIQRQINLGRRILDTGWNPTEDMKIEFARLLAEHDSARQELDAVGAECDGPVFVPKVL